MREYFARIKAYMSISKILIISVLIANGLYFIDFIDLPSKLLEKYTTEFYVMGFSVVIILVCLALMFHVKDHITAPIINIFDVFISIGMFSLLFYSIFVFIGRKFFRVNIALGLLISSAVIVFILFLLRQLSLRRNNDSQDNSNIFDFKELYYNDFVADKNRPILVKETAVEYDLLDREFIIEDLYNSIISAIRGSTYVIGINGKWGSGKTTIISNVKNKCLGNDHLIIKDFDPWLYGSQEAMLASMLEVLLSEHRIFFDKEQVSDILQIALSSKLNFSNNANKLFKKNRFVTISDVKKRIEECLDKSKKTYVFFVDNIDRADSQTIILFFKVIATLFDLPNIVYVVAYERDRLDSIFNDIYKVDSRYLDKIINQEVLVPQIPEQKLKELFSKSISNIVGIYSDNNIDTSKFQSTIDLFCSRVSDLRKVKRYINSILPLIFLGKHNLNYEDLFLLETIKFLDLDLYNDIYEHKEFFASMDLQYNLKLQTFSFSSSSFNEKAQEYFSKIPETYLIALKDRFPYVDAYLKKIFIEPINSIIEGVNIYDDVPARSAKFFDLYFSYSSNSYLDINCRVRETIEKINSTNNVDEEKDIIFSSVMKSENDLEEWLDIFYLHLINGEIKNKYDILVILFKGYYKICDSVYWIKPRRKIRMTTIFQNLLEGLSDKEMDTFFGEIREDYDKLLIIVDLLNSCNKDNTRIFNKLRELYLNMVFRIISLKIDLYSNSNYIFKNIYAIINAPKYYDYIDQNIIREYMKNCLSGNTVYRILGDAINISEQGNIIEYSLDKENIKALLIDIESIDKLIEENHPSTDSEYFVLDLYKNNTKREEKDINFDLHL